MQNQLLCRIFIFCFLFPCIYAFAQNPDDTEFRKGSVLYLKLDNGVVSNFQAAPDLFTCGILFNPQFTVVENKLRIGVNGGFAYTNKKINGLIGPAVVFKLKSLDFKKMAGLANLQLIAEHTWGSNRQRLIGGGIGLEVLQKALLLITVHRNYKLNNWWMQTHIGINLKKNKSKTPEFNQ